MWLRKFFTLFTILLLVSLSGCIKQSPTRGKFKGDIVSIENLEIWPIEVSPGDLITVHFDVVNNVEEKVRDIKVSLRGSSFIHLESMECEGKKANQDACSFDLDELDFKHVEASFRVISSPRQSQTVSITLTYPYASHATLSFAIVKPEEFKKRIPPYKQSQAPSDIVVSFDPGFLVKRKVDNRVEVVRDYMIYGSKFTLKIKFDEKKESYEASARLKNLELTLGSLVPIEDSCPDFDTSGNEVIVKTKEKDAEIPKELKCSFTNVEFEEPLRSATIVANYEYEISKIYEEKIKVM